MSSPTDGSPPKYLGTLLDHYRVSRNNASTNTDNYYDNFHTATTTGITGNYAPAPTYCYGTNSDVSYIGDGGRIRCALCGRGWEPGTRVWEPGTRVSVYKHEVPTKEEAWRDLKQQELFSDFV